MGRDKATLRVGGVGLAARAATTLLEVVPEVVVADRGRQVVAGQPSLGDGPGQGPAAGILGAAAARPGRPLLVLACDLPAVPAALLAALAATPGDLVVPRHDGGIEPLCALYRPPALAVLARRVAGGANALRDLVDEPALRVTFLEGQALTAFGGAPAIFRNLNSPDDLPGELP